VSHPADAPPSAAAPGDSSDAAAVAALDPRYQVVRRLGRGATAAVYLARDRELHRVVAVKVLRPELRDDAAAAERFRDEARLSVQLAHPGIVPVYAYERGAALPYLVMPYVDGGSLADRLDRLGRAPVDETRRVLLDLADVLDYAHRRGVVHRDVKPENVLMAAFGASYRPLLCDFGVAARPLLDRGAGHVDGGAGTAAYASPEQWWGTADVDRRSDLYSLGVLGYRMLAGVRPYDGPNAAAIAARQAAGGHVPLAAAAPHAPRAVCAVIERCLAADPADRWRNAREFRDALLAAPLRGRRRRALGDVARAAARAVAARVLAAGRARGPGAAARSHPGGPEPAYLAPDGAVANAVVTGRPTHPSGTATPSSHSAVAAVSIVRTPGASGGPGATPAPHAIQGIVTSSESALPWVRRCPPWSAVTSSV
jgi:serine/threonine-protein kinase